MHLSLTPRKSVSLLTLAAIGFAVGPKNIAQHAKALITGTRQTVENLASDDHLVRLLSAQVEDARKTIRKGDLLLKRHADRAAELETEVARIHSVGDTARARLAVLRPAVEAKDGLLINSVRYSADEVLREANALVASVAESHREECARNAELKIEKDRIAAARGSLENARTQLTSLQNKTRDLELRLASARAGAETRSLVKDLNDEIKDQVEGRATHTLAVLEERIAEMEVEAAESSTSAIPQGIVQWDTQPATSDRIKSILDTGSVVYSAGTPCPNTK